IAASSLPLAMTARRAFGMGTSATLLPCCEAHEGRLNDAAFSPDGRFVLTAGDDGTAQIHPFEVGGTVDDLLRLAQARVTRDFTPEERKKYLPPEPLEK